MTDSYILQGLPSKVNIPEGLESLPDLLEWQANRRNDAPLFSFCPEGADSNKINTMSYRQVYDQTIISSQHLHSILSQQQQQRGSSVVGIWFEKSIELHLAILAASFAGAGWLPFDADAPSARVNCCLIDSNASILLCDRIHAERAQEAVSQTNTIVVVWDDFIKLIQSQSQSSGSTSPSKTPIRPRSSDTAYFIYTSGSTGTPKGIEISHGAALTFAFSEQSVLGTNSSDIVWQGFSPAFDMFIEEV